MKKKSKGVYCLEIGEWSSSLKESWSVEPILKLLHRSPLGVPYIHRDIATKAELEYYIRKWTQQRHKDYPVMYLAFYGESGSIELKAPNGKSDPLSIEDLFAMLKGKCNGRVVHFGACKVLKIHGNSLNKFVRQSGALAVSGYRVDVDWVLSSVFEMLYLSELQKNVFDGRGIKSVKTRLRTLAPEICQHLEFLMSVKKMRKPAAVKPKRLTKRRAR